MAIAWNSLKYEGENVGTSVTVSVTVPTGSNRVLVVGHGHSGSAGTVSGTFNGDSLTLGPSESLNGVTRRMLYLVAPDEGTFDLVINTSNSVNNSAWGLTITGADQAAPNVQGSNAVDGTAEMPINMTTTADDCWLFAHAYMNGAVSFDTGATTLGMTTATYGYYSGGSVGAAGAKSMTISSNAGSPYGMTVGMGFKPQVDSGPTNMKTWDGLAKAGVKTMDGLALASVKTWNGLT